ncbi:MAG TPA: class I mannose-6-phosphate isomerase [Bryobacteraceae bacterium]|nr:class I mannose-6-phosphate isomerase [Bryobacteraceae bacterium]
MSSSLDSADRPQSYLHPIQLMPVFRERIWGRKSLMPFFPRVESEANSLIGEAWLTFEENLTSLGISFADLLRRHPETLGVAGEPNRPGICPLLVKFIFTTERLSVQVHPDDTYAELHHRSLGKTEAWYVVDAQPGAEVAVGFREALAPERLKATAQSGEIEHLLAWHKVKAGDIVFVPAGTVHAIGAGLTICEVQENSDITYRLYDYGRPRELHLEHGMAVSRLEPCSFDPEPRRIAKGRDALTESKYFRIERLQPKRAVKIEGGSPYYFLLICLRGEGTIADSKFAAGQAWFIPARAGQFSIDGSDSEWVLAYTSDEAFAGIAVD